MAIDAVTAEEMQEWYTPKRVIDLLPGDWPLALKREQITHRMQAGTIRTAALRTVVGENDAPAAIGKGMWKTWAFLADDGSAESFWLSASFEKFETQPRDLGPTIHYQLFGIRLNPEDVAAMLVELGLRVAPTSRRGKLAAALEAFEPASQIAPDSAPATLISKHTVEQTPRSSRVSDSQLRAWFVKHDHQFPGQVHRVVKDAAVKRFSPKDVGKRQLYRVMSDVRGGLTIGNPSISRSKVKN